MRSLAPLLLGLLATPALSVPINYGDFVGADVTYRQVTEDSSTDVTPLYGSPTVAGNSLNFDPVGFGASTTGGGTDDTVGDLVFTIEADAGYLLDEIVLAEAGDYTIFGAGTATTEVKVSAPVEVTITEVDGVALITPILISTAMTFAPSDSFDLANDGEGFGVIWNGSVTVDLTQALIDEGVAFSLGATEVFVDIDNMLSATSEAGSSATIGKKDFDGLSIAIVPEPSSVLLLSLGLAGLAWQRGRV